MKGKNLAKYMCDQIQNLEHLMLTKHKQLKFLLKDTIRDYFCERNVFFYTTTLSSLFHLF